MGTYRIYEADGAWYYEPTGGYTGEGHYSEPCDTRDEAEDMVAEEQESEREATISLNNGVTYAHVDNLTDADIALVIAAAESLHSDDLEAIEAIIARTPGKPTDRDWVRAYLMYFGGRVAIG